MSISNGAESLSGSIDPPESDDASASPSPEAGLSGGEVESGGEGFTPDPADVEGRVPDHTDDPNFQASFTA